MWSISVNYLSFVRTPDRCCCAGGLEHLHTSRTHVPDAVAARLLHSMLYVVILLRYIHVFIMLCCSIAISDLYFSAVEIGEIQ